MGSKTQVPPDSWEVGSGVWQTDIEINDDQFLIGGSTLKFLATTPGADPQLISDRFMQVVGGSDYVGSASFRVSSITAGNTVRMGIQFFDREYTLLSTIDIYDAILTAINIFERKDLVIAAPATAAWAKIILEKNNTAFSAHMDDIRFRLATPEIVTTDGTARSIPKNTIFTIPFQNAVTHNLSYNSGTGVVTVITPGHYVITAREEIANTPNNTDIRCGILVNGTLLDPKSRLGYRHDKVNVGFYATTLSAYIQLDEGETVEYFVFHNANSSLNSGGASEKSYFSMGMVSQR